MAQVSHLNDATAKLVDLGVSLEAGRGRNSAETAPNLCLEAVVLGAYAIVWPASYVALDLLGGVTPSEHQRSFSIFRENFTGASKPLQQLHEEYQRAVGDCSALSPPSDRVADTIMEETAAEQKLGSCCRSSLFRSWMVFMVLGAGRPCCVFASTNTVSSG